MKGFNQLSRQSESEDLVDPLSQFVKDNEVVSSDVEASKESARLEAEHLKTRDASPIPSTRQSNSRQYNGRLSETAHNSDVSPLRAPLKRESQTSSGKIVESVFASEIDGSALLSGEQTI